MGASWYLFWTVFCSGFAAYDFVYVPEPFGTITGIVMVFLAGFNFTCLIINWRE